MIIATIASWYYPVAAVASIYVTYLVAWAALSYAPRPWIDDPKFIGGWVDGFSYVTDVLIVGIPAGAIVCLVLTVVFVVRRYNWATVPAYLAGLIGLWITTFVFLRWDPVRVLDWYID